MPNSFVTAHALFDDTCAANFDGRRRSWEPSCWTARRTAPRPWADRRPTSRTSCPSRSCRRPSRCRRCLPSSAASRSDPTSTISSFRPKLSARAAAMSTSMPTILDDEAGCPAKRLVVGVHADAQHAVFADCRRCQRGRFLGGSIARCDEQPARTASRAAMHATAMQQDASVLYRFITGEPPSSLIRILPLSTDLVFAPTLAHRGSSLRPCPLARRSRMSRIHGRCGLPLGYAMIVARNRAAYVDPFDRICHGLRLMTTRNYRLERSIDQCTR